MATYIFIAIPLCSILRGRVLHSPSAPRYLSCELLIFPSSPLISLTPVVGSAAPDRRAAAVDSVVGTDRRSICDSVPRRRYSHPGDLVAAQLGPRATEVPAGEVGGHAGGKAIAMVCLVLIFPVFGRS